MDASIEGYNLRHELGRGNSGRVLLAERKSDRELVAIKIIRKETIVNNQEEENVRMEHEILERTREIQHPFLIHLLHAFETNESFCFVTPWMRGGDLMSLIQQAAFSAKQTQLYAAELCLALQCLHENGIIHRHVKLDNILLDADGHVKLADYGVSKDKIWFGSTTRTFCGGGESMAPEVLLDKPYGRAVDWWAYGVVLYQMILRRYPFEAETEDETMDAILSLDPSYPDDLPGESVSILKGLLRREAESRLGSGEEDARQVMSQPYFHNIDWDQVLRGQVQPVFVPELRNNNESSISWDGF